MIDTPRTDAETKEPDVYYDVGGYVSGTMRESKHGDYVLADFARQLERELAEAKKDRDEYKHRSELASACCGDFNARNLTENYLRVEKERDDARRERDEYLERLKSLADKTGQCVCSQCYDIREAERGAQ